MSYYSRGRIYSRHFSVIIDVELVRFFEFDLTENVYSLLSLKTFLTIKKIIEFKKIYKLLLVSLILTNRNFSKLWGKIQTSVCRFILCFYHMSFIELKFSISLFYCSY